MRRLVNFRRSFSDENDITACFRNAGFKVSWSRGGRGVGGFLKPSLTAAISLAFIDQ